MFCQATSRRNRWVACLPRGRSGFWRTGWFPFLSVSAISMLLFYRWRACWRASCQKHIQTLDLHFRKFFRSIVSPSPCTSTALSTCFVELCHGLPCGGPLAPPMAEDAHFPLCVPPFLQTWLRKGPSAKKNPWTLEWQEMLHAGNE